METNDRGGGRLDPVPFEQPISFTAEFDKQSVPEEVYLRVLDEAEAALSDADIPHLFVGGIASAVLGRPRLSLDIDFLVRPHDAKRVLEALAEAGFSTQETDPDWLFKAVKDGVVIDVIFRSTGEIYLDDEMMERSRVEPFSGRVIRLASPEDVLVMKALAHTEQTPRYWFDALGIIARTDLDWDYLLRRARHGVNRVLSLLLYARSTDLVVPQRVVRELFELAATQTEEPDERSR